MYLFSAYYQQYPYFLLILWKYSTVKTKRRLNWLVKYLKYVVFTKLLHKQTLVKQKYDSSELIYTDDDIIDPNLSSIELPKSSKTVPSRNIEDSSGMGESIAEEGKESGRKNRRDDRVPKAVRLRNEGWTALEGSDTLPLKNLDSTAEIQLISSKEDLSAKEQRLV